MGDRYDVIEAALYAIREQQQILGKNLDTDLICIFTEPALARLAELRREDASGRKHDAHCNTMQRGRLYGPGCSCFCRKKGCEPENGWPGQRTETKP